MRRVELFVATRATLVDKIFPGVHGTRRFITVFISDHYWFVSRALNSFRVLSVICNVILSPDLLLGFLICTCTSQIRLFLYFTVPDHSR